MVKIAASAKNTTVLVYRDRVGMVETLQSLGLEHGFKVEVSDSTIGWTKVVLEASVHHEVASIAERHGLELV